MRKLLISAAVIGLFTLPALAQDHDHGHGGGQQGAQAPQGGPPGGGHDHGGGGGPHFQPGPNPSYNRGPGGGGNPGHPPAMTGNPGYSRGPGRSGFDHAAPANPAYSRGPAGGGFDRQAPTGPAYTRGSNGGGDFHRDFHNGASNVNPGGPNMAGRPGGDFNRGQGFNRGGPGGGHHDFHGFVDFHQNFNAPRRFHVGAYRRPPGWYPHRWAFGEYLPAPFWARDYWLMDYMDYALPPPPPYAVWVRYGDDALLIDQDTGEIITVEYGVFY